MTDQDVIGDGDADELMRLKHAAFSREGTPDDRLRLAAYLAARENPEPASTVDPSALSEPSGRAALPPSHRRALVVAAIAGLCVVGAIGWQLQPTGPETAVTPGSAPTGPDTAPDVETALDDEASALAVFERPAEASDQPLGDVAGSLHLDGPQTRRIAEVDGIAVFAVIGIRTDLPEELLADLGTDHPIMVCLYSDTEPDPEFGYDCALVRDFDQRYVSLHLPRHVVRWGMSESEPLVFARG